MKKEKLKKVLYIFIPILFIFIIGIIFTTGIGFNLLSGNSVTGNYYYCEDSSYELSGARCKKILTTSPYLVGDVNHDGEISIEDVTYIQYFLAGKRQFDEFDKRLADVNKDGVVDNQDSTIIQQYMLGIVEETNTIRGSSGVILEQPYKLGTDKLCPINYKYDKSSDNCIAKEIKDAIRVDFVYGDVNEDKAINDEDYALVKSYIAGSRKLSDKQLKIADYNRDGNVDIEDLKSIDEEINKSKSVNVTLNIDNSKDIQKLFIGDDVTFHATFKEANNSRIYYKWYNVKSDSDIVESSCKTVTNNLVDSYKINLETESSYVVLKTFSSSDCTNMINEYKTDVIKASVKPSVATLEYKVTNLKEPSTVLAYNTNLSLSAIFKVEGNSKFYYKRFEYHDSKPSSKRFKCTPIENNMEEKSTIFVNSETQYMKWDIYSDSSCKNLVNSYETEKYNSISSFNIYTESNKLIVGSNLKLSVKAGSSLKNIDDLVTWSSSDDKIAVVDKNGNVTALKEGNVVISAKLGNVTSNISLSVVNEIVEFEYKLTNKNITGNLVDKGTVLTFYSKFNVNSNKKYYFMWEAIKYGNTYNTPVCKEIKDGMEFSPQLTINGPNQHGRWTIFSDSNCKKIVNTYETKYYNYYADSINLNVKSKSMAAGSKYKFNAAVSTKIYDAEKYVKWSSSNVSVATVDANGNVTAKKSGTANITASIGNMSSTVTVTVPQPGEDKNLNCPLIDYEASGSKINIMITPNGDIKKYDIYFSTNDHIGSYANFQLYQSGISGKKTVSNLFKNHYSNQAKIVVYGASGSSRNCYTAPLTWRWTTGSTYANCPSFSYNYEKSGNIYTYKVMNEKITSGVNVLTVNFKLNKDYQYNWFTSNKDGSYKLFKTYSTASSSASPTVSGQWYERNGQVVVTDAQGNIKVCKTDKVNNIRFNKTTYGNTDLYIESGYGSSKANAIKNKVSQFNSNYPQYLSVGKIFAYTNSTYSKVAPSGSCGFISNRSVNVSDVKSGCEPVGSLVHELGHGIDYMNGYVTYRLSKKYDLRDYVFSYNGKNTNISSYYSYYKGNYNLRTSYLRDYAYTNNEEFWAELFAYGEKGFSTDSTLRGIRSKALDKYTSLYKSNKSTWNSIKEQYR